RRRNRSRRSHPSRRSLPSDRSLVGRLESALATSARDYAVVRAGAVGWRGGAILVPAAHGSGTSTLVGELVRRGARYYSDEWGALDDAGHVHACTPGGSPVSAGEPVTLVVATVYRPGRTWEPLILQGARALLRVIDRATMLPSEPARVLRLVRKLGRAVVTLESPRPEAETLPPPLPASAH